VSPESAGRRLKAGGSQNWLPHKAAAPQPKIKESGVDTMAANLVDVRRI
jgi:hypothetical protein